MHRLSAARLWRLALLLAVLAGPAAAADGALQRLETRPGVTVPLYVMARPEARATLVLLPGGAGGMGPLVNGEPSGRNFLVRSREDFAAAGFNVIVMSRASDKSDLDTASRLGKDHLRDIRAVVAQAKASFGQPVWLVGTSRGTVSAAAAAIAFGNSELAGIVLSSSIFAWKLPGALPRQDLAAIRIPVLLVHHARDACWACRPQEAPAVLAALSQAPVRRLLLVDGGGEPQGDPCEALHYHGYIGSEREVVRQIAEWIRQPRND